jgi:sugar phosphate isomerase/epimerase
MHQLQMSRRNFLKTSAVAVTAASTLSVLAETRGVSWPIGCFNRPWMKSPKLTLDFDATLDAIKAAGYKSTGLLTPTEGEPFTSSSALPKHAGELKRKIEKRGLKAVMTALRTKNDLPLAEQIADVRKQIDNGKRVGVEFLLTFGVDKAEHFANYYKVMQDAAAYAEDRALKLVLKPHGGASGASEEIIRCMEKVKHPNFKIWFDAGNIIYYTGKDPLEQLKPIAQHVTGFCAKDCDKRDGNVWIQFGTGAVDFKAVFGELKRVGFSGPVMVECCAMGETAAEVTANAQANREYLEKVFASL